MNLKVNWPYLIFCLVTWGLMCGFIGGMVTAQTINAVRQGLSIPGSWSWNSVIVLDLGCLAAFLWLALKIRCDINTTITDDYVRQIRLFGSFEIAWSQVTRITIYGYGITLYGQGGQIVLTPYAYKNPDEVKSKVIQMAEHYSIQITASPSAAVRRSVTSHWRFQNRLIFERKV